MIVPRGRYVFHDAIDFVTNLFGTCPSSYCSETNQNKSSVCLYVCMYVCMCGYNSSNTAWGFGQETFFLPGNGCGSCNAGTVRCCSTSWYSKIGTYTLIFDAYFIYNPYNPMYNWGYNPFTKWCQWLGNHQWIPGLGSPDALAWSRSTWSALLLSLAWMLLRLPVCVQ